LEAVGSCAREAGGVGVLVHIDGKGAEIGCIDKGVFETVELRGSFGVDGVEVWDWTDQTVELGWVEEWLVEWLNGCRELGIGVVSREGIENFFG
jgi:hypothetical protein